MGSLKHQVNTVLINEHNCVLLNTKLDVSLTLFVISHLGKSLLTITCLFSPSCSLLLQIFLFSLILPVSHVCPAATCLLPLITLKAVAHKLGSAPSQYFQGDGAKPRAQSHNLSYNSTGWVASAVLVNTLFHSVCLLINHLRTTPFPLLICTFMSWFHISPKYLLFPVYPPYGFILNISFSLFLLHLRAGSASKFQPSSHLTFHSPIPPFFMVSHFQCLFQVLNRQQLICIVVFSAAFHWGFGWLCFTDQVL